MAAGQTPISAKEEPFCPKTEMTVPTKGKFNVYIVQAPVEDNQPEDHGLAFHPALVFMEDTVTDPTLAEFGALGQQPVSATLSFGPRDASHGVFPQVVSETQLDWSGSVVGYCFTKGVLNGVNHWSVWKQVATLTAVELTRLMDYLQPWRVVSRSSYQMFRVEDKVGTELLPDMTTGHGVLLAIDFIHRSLRKTLQDGYTSADDVEITSMRLVVSAIQQINTRAEAGMVHDFYRKAVESPASGMMDRVHKVYSAEMSGVKYVHANSEILGQATYRVDVVAPYLRITHGPRPDWRNAFEGRVRADECRVLAGPVAMILQFALFLCCCCLLFYKYIRQSNGRSIVEFGMDSSKQLFGAGWIHILNLFYSVSLKDSFGNLGDECEWYWVNIVVDCTLGVFITYVLLKLMTKMVIRAGAEEADSLQSGTYTSKDGTIQLERYAKQLVMWLGVVTLMKIAVLAIMGTFSLIFIFVAKVVLFPFAWNSTTKLAVVMIFTPIFMNSLQFWVTDNFIRKPDVHDGIGYEVDVEVDTAMRTRVDHGDL
eukprot:TRINITY_DN23008_c0_g1_i1.p1 TRINITY_DN23008_c0_g1~~TRINITY_DN23008_c0_g1_i1.p1  ORF type:complete len:568 (+),score=76.48 TRINITY_DN23008_c0_g1_i1:90-1706(+)